MNCSSFQNLHKGKNYCHEGSDWNTVRKGRITKHSRVVNQHNRRVTLANFHKAQYVQSGAHF